MIIHISIDDIPAPYNDPLRLEHLYNVGIDYATNTIDALDKTEVDELGNYKYISIFHFSDWDIRISNRFNTYEISWGAAGITLSLKNTKPLRT